MIDLHCHILPALDDGARDLDDSAAMARQAEDDGIELVCATPHIRHDHDVRIHEIAERVESVNRALEERGLAARVASGGEVAETAAAALDEEELRQVALGGGERWLLVEPAPGPVSDTLVETVERLAARGHEILVAHPERHLGEGAIERIEMLVERGALVQLTAAFLLEPATAPTMIGLAERGLAHVLGSDAHSPHFGRRVALAAGHEVLRGVPLLAPHIDWIAREAPRAIVAGERLTVPWAA